MSIQYSVSTQLREQRGDELYKDLKVYQRSYKLAISLYKFAGTMPKEERYGLTSQIKRAATSIPLNIAEGYGKHDTNAEIKRYLRMAKGSCNELDILIEMCKDLNFIEKSACEKYVNEIQEIGAMLYGLMKSLN